MGSNRPVLAPSLLAANHARLYEAAVQIRETGLKWVHFDVMDGHFVPNINFGPKTLADLHAELPELFYDVHLMLDEPWDYIDAFAEAGADLISVHVEPDYDELDTLAAIRRHGCQCGIVLNPGTPLDAVERSLRFVDLVLLMTVQPGKGGQAFREDVLPKVEALAKRRSELGLTFRIEVDGGIGLETGQRCRDAGADTFVAGTAFFKADDKPAFAKQLLG